MTGQLIRLLQHSGRTIWDLLISVELAVQLKNALCVDVDLRTSHLKYCELE